MSVRFSMGLLLALTAACAVGCQGFRSHNLPPATRLMEPGPGVGGPGPGVLPPVSPAMPPMGFAPGMMGPGMMGPGMMGPGMMQGAVSQVYFASPEGMRVQWDVTGMGTFDSMPLITPGRHNFPQGGIYRLKLTNMPAREGVELYPTLEIGPATPRTEAYLAHNAIPVQFTEEDFDQVLTGNFVTKVIYLPDPQFQELALAGVETLVSTRLDPGVDPIVEADRRGAILAVIRLGNLDVEMPGPDGQMSIMPTGFAGTPGIGGPMMHVGGQLPGPISGMNSPTWGMPMSGTPIGLAGPPHVPLGGPAGLQRHVIRNHTSMHLPPPTESIRMNVRQTPGMSYPQPPNRVNITERAHLMAPPASAPWGNSHERVQGAPEYPY